MTKKEMIEKCVDNQIERGIIRKESRKIQISSRMKPGGHYMTLIEVEEWYNSIFNK